MTSEDQIEHAVLEYLAAIEARRAAPSDFPQPDHLAHDVATGAMVSTEPATDPEGLQRDVAAHTPGSEANIARLEDGFVAAAKAYGERHDIRYEGWLQSGVDPEVLHRAGIHSEPE